MLYLELNVKKTTRMLDATSEEFLLYSKEEIESRYYSCKNITKLEQYTF